MQAFSRVQVTVQPVAQWRDDGWGSIQPDLVLLQLEDLASDATALVSVCTGV
jgi:hypothetical protein